MEAKQPKKQKTQVAQDVMLTMDVTILKDLGQADALRQSATIANDDAALKVVNNADEDDDNMAFEESKESVSIIEEKKGDSRVRIPGSNLAGGL